VTTVSTTPRLLVPWTSRVGRGLFGGGLRRSASRASWFGFLLVGALLPFRLDEAWTFIVTVGLVLAVSCAGLRVLGWSRQISLMQAGLTGAAMHLDLWLFGWRGWGARGLRHHFLFSAVVTVAFTIAVAVGLIAARRALLLSVAVSLAAQLVLERVLQPAPCCGGPATPAGSPRQFLGLDLGSDRAFYLFAFAVLLVVLAGMHRLRAGRFGRAMVAVGTDPVAAAAHGINPVRVRVGAFAVAGALAGLAGVLSAPLYGRDFGPQQWGSVQSLVYVAVAVVAGRRSGPTLVLAAVGAAVLPQVFRDELSTLAPRQLGAGIAMLLVLLVRPYLAGLFGRGVFPRGRVRRVPSLVSPVPAAHPRTAVRVATVPVVLSAFGLSAAVRHGGPSLPVGITEFGIGGSDELSAIAAGPDGNLWFTQDHRIGRITPTGAVTSFGVLPRYGQRYTGITNVGGNLWFAQLAEGVGRISLDGTISAHPAAAGAKAYAVGSDGNLWMVRDRAGVGRISASGAVTSYPVPGKPYPTGLTAGPDGIPWFTGPIQDRILRITPTGKITAIALLSWDLSAGGFTTGPDGNVWFADDRDNRIWRITPAGRITSFGGLPAEAAPSSLVAGPDGNLWFVYRDHLSPRLSGVLDNHTLARITRPG
jgi:virginiamycin B lyase